MEVKWEQQLNTDTGVREGPYWLGQSGMVTSNLIVSALELVSLRESAFNSGSYLPLFITATGWLRARFRMDLPLASCIINKGPHDKYLTLTNFPTYKVQVSHSLRSPYSLAAGCLSIIPFVYRTHVPLNPPNQVTLLRAFQQKDVFQGRPLCSRPGHPRRHCPV